MAHKKRIHVFVSGRVQGVFFRDSTRTEALRRNVTGWVRNLPDGRVEAVFEGDESAVNDLVNWTRIGPPGSFVTHIDAYEEAYVGEYSTFAIQRTPY